MKRVMIAALAAAQLFAAQPAAAAERPGEEATTQPTRFDKGAGPILDDGQSRAAARAAAAEDDEPRKKKRKSTGDKVLTGAAVILGIGALAVGGLLVAIFVG